MADEKVSQQNALHCFEQIAVDVHHKLPLLFTHGNMDFGDRRGLRLTVEIKTDSGSILYQHPFNFILSDP